MSRSSPVHRFLGAALAATLLVAGACAGDDGDSGAAAGDTTTTTPDRAAVKLNHLQVIGSHNSYRLAPRDEIATALQGLAPSLYEELEYTHLPLTEQLEEHGIRQFELDVMADPDGGLYATPAALDVLGIEEEPDPALQEPGFKVQHIQDLDYNTTCLTLVACLEEIEDWSSRNPTHLPLMVMIETKTQSIAEGAASLGVDLPDLGADFTDPPAMTPELFDDLEAEILSVIDRERIIAPDDVRGDRSTLEEAVLDDGWPTVEESRGKVLFSLVDTGESADVYRQGAPSLEGRLAFTSATPGEPDAAFLRVDDSLADGDDIERWALDGYLIRTRTDVPGVHAPAGDISLRDSALASGGHYLSTDYYVPDERTDYVVQLPGGAVARCNPVTAPPDCDDDGVGEG
jgi:hypothetical protein